jgi:hypothetical protein
MATQKGPWFVAGAGLVLSGVKFVADLAEDASKAGHGITGVLNLTLGQIIQPLGIVLVFVGMWWWLRRELAELRGEVNQERAHLRAEAQRMADNFSAFSDLLEEKKKAAAQAAQGAPK